VSLRFSPLPDPGPSPREIAPTSSPNTRRRYSPSARVAERRRPILEWVRVLREQTGDPNQLGDVREDVLVVIALLARDFGGRHLLAPTRHHLAELADMGLHPTHVDRALGTASTDVERPRA